jgi:hypothetical protein
MNYNDQTPIELHIVRSLAARDGFSHNIHVGDECIAHVDKVTREARITNGVESFYLDKEEYEILSNPVRDLVQ